MISICLTTKKGIYISAILIIFCICASIFSYSLYGSNYIGEKDDLYANHARDLHIDQNTNQPENAVHGKDSTANEMNINKDKPLAYDILDCIVNLSPTATTVASGKYNDSRIGTNFRYDADYPILILNVTSNRDVQAAVVCATTYDVNVIPMNGGHSFEGMSCTGDILLHMDSFHALLDRRSSRGSSGSSKSKSRSGSGGDNNGYMSSSSSSIVSSMEGEIVTTLTIQAGVRLARLYGLVIEYSDLDRSNGSDVATPTTTDTTYVIGGGTCPTVGVVGHILCGGYGMMGRSIGLTSDQVTAIEYVDSTGALETATATNKHKDIFWAMRGGCSSAFGIIVSITLQLTKTKAAITTIDLPIIPYTTADIEYIAVWWQHWAAIEVIDACTSTWTFTSSGVHLQAVYMGSMDDEEYHMIIKQLYIGFRGAISMKQLLIASHEGNFLDAVTWWSGDSSINTVNDLLAVTSLPPLDTRSTSRRKSKSLIALKDVISSEGVLLLIHYRELNGVNRKLGLNAIEWKAYGGVNTLSNEFYTDDRSPLLRGHLIEMHYGNSYGDSGSVQEDAYLVNSVNNIADNLAKYFSAPAAYIGYVDYELDHPGSSYFGLSNALKLSTIIQAHDPSGVLASPASEYLYPSSADGKGGSDESSENSGSSGGSSIEHMGDHSLAHNDIYIGSFSSIISQWKLSSAGELAYVSNVDSVYRNPSWLVSDSTSNRGGVMSKQVEATNKKTGYIYSVNQIKDFEHINTDHGAIDIARGGISAYRILDNGSLEYIHTVGSGGGSPNHASIAEILDDNRSVDASGNALYVANSCGSVSTHTISPIDGSIDNFPVQVLVVGSSSAKNVLSCNSTSFLHQIYAHGPVVYVVDRDNDIIYYYTRSMQTGALIAETKRVLTLPSHSGPRHLLFHQYSEYAFLISEFSSTITVLRVLHTGSLEIIFNYSMLRAGESNNDMAAAELQISRNGLFLYGSNRDVSEPNENRSSIVVFKFNYLTGELQLLQHVSSYGIHPRHFNIFYMDSESWSLPSAVLVVANKDSNSLVSFIIDSNYGYIKFSGYIESTLPYHDQPVFVL